MARALSRRDAKYHLRLGAFFDPLDSRPKGDMPPNALHAYDEYSQAGGADARQKMNDLAAWLARPESSGVEGAAELKAKLGM